MNRQRSQRAHAARIHRRAAKAARARNRGRWDALTGEDKTCAMKRAFKRQFEGVAMLTPVATAELNAPPILSADKRKLESQPVSRFLPHWLDLRPKPIEEGKAA